MRQLVNLFKGQAPDGTYEDAARREAMAQALRERAMRQRGPQAGGPVQAQYGIGEGLTQLAEALLARRAGRSAIDAKKQADTQQTQRNDETLREMLPATEMQSQRMSFDAQGNKVASSNGQIENMQSDALSMALRGQDPQAIGKFLAERKLQTLLPDPAEVADRDFKMFQVSATMADKAESRQQRLQELELRLADQALNREQRAAAAAEAAALRREIAAGNQATQRAIADQTDATRRAQLDAKIEADRKAAPQSTAVESAQGFLVNAGYDPRTGEDDITKLLDQAGGGLIKKALDAGARAADVTTDRMAAGNTLKSRASEAVLDFLGGKLGAGVSNADRDFMMQRAGDIGNENLSTGERRAAWLDVRKRMERIAAAAPPAAPNAPAAPSAGGMSFATEAEAEAAAAAGRLKPGTKVVIGGVSGTWQ